MSSLVLVFLLDLWLETAGLPGRYRDRLVAALAARGIQTRVDAVRGGFVRGLRLEGVTVYDRSLGNWPLLTAATVDVAWRRDTVLIGRVELTRLHVAGGRLALPLVTSADGSPEASPNLAPAVSLDGIELVVERTAGSWVLQQASGQFERLAVRGDGLLIASGIAKPLDWARLVDLTANRERLANLDPRLRQALLAAREIAASVDPDTASAVDIWLRIPLADLAASRGRIDGRLAGFVWQGQAVAQLTWSLSLEPDRWRLEDFSLLLPEEEWVRADLTVQRAGQVLRGRLTAQLSPERLLALRHDRQPGKVALPSFAGAPPRLDLRAHAVPLLDLGASHLSATVEAEAFSWGAIDVQQLLARIELAPGRWRLEEMRLQLTDDEWVRGSFALKPESWVANGRVTARLYPESCLELAGWPLAADVDSPSYLAGPPLFNLQVREWPLLDPERARLELSADLEQVLWRGLAVSRLTGRVEIDPDRWTLRDARLQLDAEEWLQASAVLDPATRTVQEGQLLARMYPDRLLKLAAAPVLASPYYPIFHGPPPYVQVTATQVPWAAPEQGTYDAYVETRDTQIVNGAIDHGRGRLHWANGVLDVSQLDGMLTDGTRLDCQLSLVPATRYLWLHAAVDGEPHFVPRFSPHQSFAAFFDRVWERFAWRSAVPPQFDFDLVYWRDGQVPNLVLVGSSAMHDFTYNGQPVDTATAMVLVDMQERLLLVDDLRVDRHQQTGTGTLAFAWPQDAPRRLAFAVASELEPPVLLRLIQPRWQEGFAKLGIQVPDGAKVTARGEVAFAGDAATSAVRGRIMAPRVDYRGFISRGNQADFELGNGQLRAHLAASGVTFANHSVDRPQLMVESDYRTVALAGTADAMRFGDFTASDLVQELRLEDGHLRGDLQVRRGRLESATNGPLTVGRLELLDLDAADGKATGTLHLVNVKGRGIQLADFMGPLQATAHAFSLEGQGRTLRLDAIDGRSEALTLAVRQSQRQTIIEASTPRLTCPELADLHNASVKLVQVGQYKQGICRVDETALGALGTAYGTAATFQTLGDTVHFQTTTETWTMRQIDWHGVEAWGTRTPNNIVVDLSSWQATVGKRFRLTDVRGPMSYQNGVLGFNFVEADAYGGTVTGNARVDLERRLGTLHVAADKLLLEDLPLSLEEPPRKRDLRGLLTGQAALRFTNLEQEGLLLYGGGEATIRDGSIYKLPVLSDFLDLFSKAMTVARFNLLRTDDFGSITTLDTAFSFHADTVRFDSLRTNGSVVALAGDGDYWWKTGGVDFRLYAQLLEKVLPGILSWPFESLLERRYRGTLSAGQWEKLSGIREVFRGGDAKPVDPTLDVAATESTKKGWGWDKIPFIPFL